MRLGRYLRAGLLMMGPLALGVFAWCVNPAGAGWLPVCPFYSVTGLYCPGCGSTRAIHQLVHGNLSAAIALNPIVVVLAPVMIALFVCELSAALGGPLRLPRVSHKLVWVLLAVLVVFGLVRNVPVYPLTLLAPR